MHPIPWWGTLPFLWRYVPDEEGYFPGPAGIYVGLTLVTLAASALAGLNLYLATIEGWQAFVAAMYAEAAQIPLAAR